MYTEISYTNSLCHYGIKDQKWGVRRYQNEDGTLTTAGKQRYYKIEYKPAKEEYKEAKSELRKAKRNYNKKFDKAQKYEDKKYNAENVNSKVQAKRDKKWAEADKAETRYDNAIDNYNTSKEKFKEKRKEVWNNVDKKKLAVGVGTIAATAATVYVLSDPGRRKAAKDFANKAGKVTAKTLKESSKKAGKAMIEGGIASAGVIGINKLAKKLETDANASEAKKNVNKIALDSATAGINSVTKANKIGNSINNQNGGSIGKNITDKVGAPKADKGSAKRDPNYSKLLQNLPGDQNQQANLKSEIKSMASAGYSIDQINSYINSIYHSSTKGYYAIIRLE